MDDLISKEQAIDKIKKRLFETAFNNVGIKQNIDETLVDVAENRLENWFNELPSIQPEIIRCKDCKYYKFGICIKAGVNKSFYGFCDWAERGEQDE